MAGKVILISLACLVGILGIAWLAQGNDFFMYKMFAPKYAAVQRQVFESTPSYRQGMIQELQNMQFEYEKADSSAQAALADIILHRVAAYGEDKLPSDLQSFVAKLKSRRLGSGY